MIPITPNISIDDSAIEERFIRASGPGGQNVNKVATAVQLRFDVANAASLPGDVRARLIRLAGRRMTTEGVLVIEAPRYRTRDRNRADALARRTAHIQRAAGRTRPARKPPPRRERGHPRRRAPCSQGGPTPRPYRPPAGRL